MRLTLRQWVEKVKTDTSGPGIRLVVSQSDKPPLGSSTLVALGFLPRKW